MKAAGKSADQLVYRQLRTLPRDQLWREEVVRFDAATPAERIARVALIRAVGVAFSETGSSAEKDAVRKWLLGLLQDPVEKIRRYAMTALPKIGAGLAGEAALLELLQASSGDREKKFLGRALDKVGGKATLHALEGSGATAQKIKANVARDEGPSSVRLNQVLANYAGLRIHLRGRHGLEGIVRDEAVEFISARGMFRIDGVQSGLVALAPVAPFSLADIFSLRCFGSVGLVLGRTSGQTGTALTEALASIIASPISRRVFQTLTEGTIRYRLDFVGQGHQRSAVRAVADRAYALCPEILNDARSAPWMLEIHPTDKGHSVELRPRLGFDPRLTYRQQDVPAASHPPLAACMARLATRIEGDTVWDPFCGSGLELIERALRGGVRCVYGTDLSAHALAAARANFAAAKLDSIPAGFHQADFRDFASGPELKPGSVTLIITNPPMGRRVPIPDLQGLIENLFRVAATVLRPGGRLVLANPLRFDPRSSSLHREFRQVVDFGGFDCRLELYRKTAQRELTVP